MKTLPREKSLQQVIHRTVKIPCAKRHFEVLLLEIFDQGEEARLGFLFEHGAGFDGADLGLGSALGGGGEGVDVGEDVDGFGDVEGGSREGRV